MIILGNNFNIKETFDSFMTVPDCIVTTKNKLGGGHGEAKFYISSKEDMRNFYGGTGFTAKCFLLKSDLLAYMNAVKIEYTNPSQEYRGKEELPTLWEQRMRMIEGLADIIEFNINDQTQIAGPRGYVNSKDAGYQIIREISLPLVTYISAMQLIDNRGSIIYYWKLFVDFDAISEIKNGALVFKYGKMGNEEIDIPEPTQKEKNKITEIRNARNGQGKYREQLLNECPYCPITMINDERLLIASHIKPWAASDDKEKIDPKNGYMLSPLYDKLFDRGFITFTDDRHMIVSDWISPQNCKRMNLKNNTFIQALPMDNKRMEYLKFHRSSVFHGFIE